MSLRDAKRRYPTRDHNPLGVADAVAARLAESGIRRVFGLPGGGSTSALVSALIRAGIEFRLAHTETGAALMASVEAELSGRPGVALSTLGPGIASMVNGLAYCKLDRAPVLAITDRLAARSDHPGYHQRLDHARLLAEVVKGSSAIEPRDAASAVDDALRLASSGTPGPVHLDLPVDAVRETAGETPPLAETGTSSGPPGEALELARMLLARARRPVIVAGLGLRGVERGALAGVAEELRAPVLTTYKGKGAVDERGPWSAGLITGGAAEGPLLERADLLLTVGLDGVELFSGAALVAPRVSLSARPEGPGGALTPPLIEVMGDLGGSLGALRVRGESRWVPEEAAAHREGVDGALAGCGPSSGEGLHPWEAGAVVAEKLGGGAAVTVDAGAHMFPVAQAWRATGPGEFWISNGLSTMGYALPAAVALSVDRPERPIVCMTGDGGLAMVAGELATAARFGGRLIVVVFDDASLSLIRIKQPGDDPMDGTAFSPPDWKTVAEGFGMRSWRARDVAELRRALEEALEGGGPALISASVDPAPYKEMMKVLRG